mgnify:CR=1 FL=1
MNNNESNKNNEVVVGKAPKLVCRITGDSRITSENYLRNKAERTGKSASWLLNNYASKYSISQLRKGTPLSELTDNVIEDGLLAEIVKCNSKCREEFEFVNGVYKSIKNKKPSAPKIVAEQPTQEETKEEEESTLEEVVKKVSLAQRIKEKSPSEAMEALLSNNPF